MTGRILLPELRLITILLGLGQHVRGTPTCRGTAAVYEVFQSVHKTRAMKGDSGLLLFGRNCPDPGSVSVLIRVFSVTKF